LTIRELIDELEDLAEEHGDETDVRLAQQPSWPFEYSIGKVEAVLVGGDDEEEDEASVPDDLRAGVIYIAEGRQLGYLPGPAARDLGWERGR
jgi:hypothetical protein